MVSPGTTLEVGFTVVNEYGGGQDADALPVAVLYRNGTIDGGAVVTVTKQAEAGEYTALHKLSSGYAPDDRIIISAKATLTRASDSRTESVRVPIWSGVLDVSEIGRSNRQTFYDNKNTISQVTLDSVSNVWERTTLAAGAAPGSSSFTLADGATQNDLYNHKATLVLQDSSGNQEELPIVDWNGSTKVVTTEGTNALTYSIGDTANIRFNSPTLSMGESADGTASYNSTDSIGNRFTYFHNNGATSTQTVTSPVTVTSFTGTAINDIWTHTTRTLTAATNITSDGSAINVTAGVVDTVTTVTSTGTVTGNVNGSVASVTGNVGGSVNSVVSTVTADVTHWQGFTIPGASMIENDGAGAGRWTVKALEQAPSGGGGGLTAQEVWEYVAGGGRTLTAATNITTSGAAIATTGGVIDRVTLTDTTTTNTDMRGTDNAALATELAKVPRLGSTFRHRQIDRGTDVDRFADVAIEAAP